MRSAVPQLGFMCLLEPSIANETQQAQHMSPIRTRQSDTQRTADLASVACAMLRTQRMARNSRPKPSQAGRALARGGVLIRCRSPSTGFRNSRRGCRPFRGIALLLALVFACALHATPADHAEAAPPLPTGHYIFKSYGAALGLENVGVEELLQDKTGFIWVGTDDGLYRYDGYLFDAFGLQQGLPSTEIEALHEDASGTLWVGTRSGLARWDGNQFRTVALDQAPHGIAVADVDDGPGGVWAATAQGLFVGRGEHLQRAQAWPGGEATAVWKERGASRMWVGQWDGDAHMLAWQNGSWHSVAAPADHLKERIDAIAQDGRGRLWARSARSLWVLRPGAERFETVATPFALDAQRGYLQAGVHGDLWVSTDHALFRLDGERWIDYGIDEGNRPLLEDREGSIWFGNQGLHRLLGRGVFHAYTKTEGLPGEVIWCVFRDREGRLWAGTDVGLALLNGERFEPIAGTERYIVRSIIEDEDGLLYLAGIPGNDVLSYDPANKRLRHFEIWPDNPIKRIFRLFEDRDGAFWLATEGAGLFRAAGAQQLRFVPVELPDGIPQEDIIDVRQDGEGRIWVAGQRGLALLDHGKWRRFGTRDGLRRDYLAYLRPVSNGDLLVAYRDPLGVDRMRYDGSTLHVIAHLDAATTRSADKVFMVGEDARHHVWIGGGKGVDLLLPGGTQHFGAAEGLVGEDICNQSFLAEPDGDVWVGTTQGLARFDAKVHDALPESAPPPVALTTLTLGPQTFQSDTADITVPHEQNTFAAHFSGLSYVGEGTIQYQSRLVGRESEFNVTQLHDVRYSALEPGPYRFEVAARVGAYGHWGPTSTFAFYVLPAWWQTWWFRILIALAAIGVIVLIVLWRLAALQRRNRWLEQQVTRRTLEVSQANERLSDANGQLRSEISDRIAAEQALHLRNDELLALNQKLAGTQSQLLQSEKMASVGQLAAGVAHEINNPIGFIGSNLRNLGKYTHNLFELLKEYEHLENSLPVDDANLRRVRTLKSAVDVQFLREDIPNLIAETLCGTNRVEKIVKDLREFAHPGEPERQQLDVLHGLESTLNVASHQLRSKAEVITEFAPLPPIEGVPTQLNQVFLNVLINAAQAIPERGVVTIRTGHDHDHVWIQISDNGTGIDPENLHRIFDPFFTTKPIGMGTGLGLSVSYGIVKDHGGSIDVASKLDQGSTFTIRLPVKRRRGN